MNTKRRIFLLLRPFFKGNSLESEFGFVNYYHSDPINQLLHTLAIPLLIFGILTSLSSINYHLVLLFSIFYCAIIFLFEYRIGIAYTILFSVLFGPAVIFSTQGRTSIIHGLIIFFSGLIMQGLGHYQFQGFTPAFRLFEAIFTTPAFLMAHLIIDHEKAFWKNVEKETQRWGEILNK